MDPIDADILWERLWDGLYEIGKDQARLTGEEEPVELYFRLLRSALAAKRCHIADKRTLSEPHQPSPHCWGWEVRQETGPSSVDTWVPKGNLIGWVDLNANGEKGAVYLDPDAAYSAVTAMARDTSASFAITQTVIAKRIDQAKLLLSKDTARELLTARVSVGGVRRQVLHLSMETILPTPDPTPAKIGDGF